MIALVLFACRYPDFVVAEFPEIVVQEGVLLDFDGQFPAGTDPALGARVVTNGADADWAPRRFDAELADAGTWSLNDNPANAFPLIYPIGSSELPGVGLNTVFGVDGPAGEGRIQLVNASASVTEVLPPSGDTNRFGRAAAFVPGGLLVASSGDDGFVYHYGNPTEPPLGRWGFDDRGADGQVFFLAAAQLDTDPEAEILVGANGEDGCTLQDLDCDTAVLWGLELPTGNQLVMPFSGSWVKFRYQTGGADTGSPAAPTGLVLDIDEDGCDDLVIGSPFDSDGRGEVQVLYCFEDDVPADHAVSSAGRAAFVGPDGGRFGQSMVLLDGFLVEGEPAIAVSAPGPNGGSGFVYVLRPRDLIPGAAVDLSVHDPRWLAINGGGLVDNTGEGLANIGDLDGDGRDDLAIGGWTGGSPRTWVFRTSTLFP